MITLKPRYFVLPALAVIMIASLAGTADSARGARASGCGAAASTVTDPGMRAALAHFDRSQSTGAAKVCALYRNSAP